MNTPSQAGLCLGSQQEFVMRYLYWFSSGVIVDAYTVRDKTFQMFVEVGLFLE